MPILQGDRDSLLYKCNPVKINEYVSLEWDKTHYDTNFCHNLYATKSLKTIYNIHYRNRSKKNILPEKI